MGGYDTWQPELLVGEVEAIHRAVRDRTRDAYDGMTERGPGPFSVVVPGRAADDIEAYWDEMDPLPWAEEHPVDHPDVYLDTYEGDIVDLFEHIDRYTDGAVLVEGDGRIHPYTVELTPDVTVEEEYEDGYGTKMRTALNVSALDVEPDRRGSLTTLRDYLPERYWDAVQAADHVWDATEGYSDVVAIATASATGETRVFDDGMLIRRHSGVTPARDMAALWEHALDTGTD